MLLYTDSCDHNNGGNIHPYKFRNGSDGADGNCTYVAGGGRFGTYGFYSTGSGTYGQRQVYGYYMDTTDPTFVCGFAAKIMNGPGAFLWRLIFMQNDLNYPTGCGFFDITNSGEVRLVWNGVAYDTGYFYNYGEYNYYEIKVFMHASSGYIIMRMNEDIILNVTGIDTKGTYSYVNQIGIYANAAQVYLDDIYFLNTQGSVNNDFLGDVRVEYRAPTGGGSYSQFTGSDGDALNNYQLVDDNPKDDDTTYITTDGIGSIDTYTLQDLATLAGDVKAVVYMLRARKDDSGNRRIAPITNISGSLYQKDTINLPSSYTTYWQIQELNPNTSNVWTVNEVNNLEYGVKLVE